VVRGDPGQYHRDLDTAAVILQKMLLVAGSWGIDTRHLHALALSLPVVGYHLARFAGERGARLHPAAAGALSASLLVAGLALLTRPTTFLYFEF